MVIYLIGAAVVIILAVVLFVNLSPQFGGSANKAQKAEYARSKNYRDGSFANIGDVKMQMGFNDFVKSVIGFFGPQPNSKPKKPITVLKTDSLNLAEYKDKNRARLIWFGHSAFLLQIEGKNILLDPMFGDVPAPSPMLGSTRFSDGLPIAIEKLPKIDAIVFSHDHYDHLDYGSIMGLKDKTDAFYVPLGVGVHLTKWGIEKERITELDWWEEADFRELRFVCAPAQHFSGRGLSDRGSTLWSSWIIKSTSENIFFSGDSGYGPHFKEIGQRFGPFDFAMLECGQYNTMWQEIHMLPEETAQAGIDVRAKEIMPIHWGAFKLAMHPWIEPVERLAKKAEELNIPVVTPQIGEPIFLGQERKETMKWWNDFN